MESVVLRKHVTDSYSGMYVNLNNSICQILKISVSTLSISYRGYRSYVSRTKTTLIFLDYMLAVVRLGFCKVYNTDF